MRRIHRRTFLATTAAAPFALGHGAEAQQPRPLTTLAPGAPLLERTTAFLALLPADARQAASFPWNGKQWRNWNYFGASGYTKPGLRLEQMAAPQKAAAWAVFAEVLSPDGIAKAQNVMRLQETLIEEGDAVGQRSAEKFSVSVFGTPAMAGEWGLRLEGHHLSLSFAVKNGAVVSVTPQAFAVRPARVTRGRHRGLVTIGPEENLARAIMADLSPAQQQRARVADRHLFNILSTAGQERANTKPLGLPGTDLSASQRDLLEELARTYAVKPYAAALATSQEQRLKATSLDRYSFAWYGANTPGRAFGYRVIAPTFVLEMGSIDSEGQHLHPIYHDLGNVLGTTA